MSSVQRLREFISERLTAAAGEIFTEFEKTIVQLVEEIDRQQRLLDISLNPQIILHRIDLPQHYVWKEEEVLTNQQLWNQERNSSLEQEEAEPPQRKEEPDEPEPLQMIEEEHCFSQDEQQLVLKQETDTLMVTRPSEERDCSKPEANWDQLLSQNSPEAENQDQEGSKNEHLKSRRDKELRQNKRCQQTKSHRETLDNPRPRRHTETQTDVPQLYVWNEEEVLTEEQLYQERNSSLDQNDLKPSQMKEKETESTQIKKEQQDPFISQGEEQFSLKQEAGTFTVTPPEERDCSKPEANRDQLLSQNSPEAENQNQDRSRNEDSESNRDKELKQKKRQTKDHNDEVSPKLNSHTGEKPFSCKTCGKRFGQSRYLTLHMKSHEGEKPLLCSLCGIIFTQKLSFTYHMRYHSKAKPHSCEICAKCFAHRHHLNNHMKTHTFGNNNNPHFFSSL